MSGGAAGGGRRLLHLLRRSVHLPNLKQGGTLSIRSSPRVAAPRRLDVRIIPQWRDDAQIELCQSVIRPLTDADADADADEAGGGGDEIGMDIVTTEGGGSGTLGKTSGHAAISVDLESFLKPQQSQVPDDLDSTSSLDSSTELGDAAPTTDNGSGSTSEPESTLTLTAHVPEKLNLNCRLDGPGDITIEGKMEGELGFDLHASGGNVRATKLRGDSVRIFAGTCTSTSGSTSSSESDEEDEEGGGVVHVSDLLEAQIVNVTAEGRVRAKMVNGTNVNIAAGNATSNTAAGSGSGSQRRPFESLEVDDSLALIDVGSLYTSKHGDGASLTVSKACGTAAQPRSVRVKSNHGHVSVSAASAAATSSSSSSCSNDTGNTDEYGQRVPIVELGGVNGGCDVSVDGEGESVGAKEAKTLTMAARVHVDSLTPDGVSVVTANVGDVDLTIDRKVEADLRLVSCTDASLLDADALLGEDEDELWSELARVNEELGDASLQSVQDSSSSSELRSEYISVRTDAFTPSEESTTTEKALKHVHLVDGHVDNRSHEPDSRFDLKTKPSPTTPDVNRGIGKVNLEGAAAQALEGFSGGRGGGEISSLHHRPLFAVATSGRIGVETVSWFGSIARRYGMEEHRRDLGRQATRRPRIK